MKIKTVIFAIAFLIFASCDFGFEEKVEEDFSSRYTFFAYKDESSLSSTKEYKIGEVLSSLPDFQDSSGVNTFRQGYYPDGWYFWKNPDSNNTDYKTAGLSNYAGSLSGDTYIVRSLTVSPANLYFYAAWTPITYYVRFNENGGYGSMENQEMSYDSSYNLKANTFSKSGYSFRGWGFSADSVSRAYSDEESVENLTVVKDGVVDLYAIWWKNPISIAFDSNGGEGTMNSISAKVDETTLPKNTFTRTGYSFSGWSSSRSGWWYSDEELLTEYNWPGDDDTFLAQWSPNPITLTLDANGGDGSNIEIWYYDESNTISTIPTRAGYTFLGWSKSASASSATDTYDSWFSLKEDTTLYAVWSVQSVTITYNKNGGSGSMQSQSMTYGKFSSLTKNAFSLTGYNFSGWGLGESATDVSFSDGEAISESNWSALYSAGGYLKAIWSARFTLGTASVSTALVSISSRTDTSVTLTTSTSAVSYFWTINGKMVSTEKTCTISYSDYSSGTITLLCVDSSGDTTQYKNTFTITN